MVDVIESGVRLDHDLAWELAIVQNEAYDPISGSEVKIAELQKELPRGWVKGILYRANVVRINGEAKTITDEIDAAKEDTEAKQSTIEEGVAQNRRKIEDVNYFFNIFDKEATRRYFETHDVHTLLKHSHADLGMLRNIGTVFHGEPGTRTIALFDSSKPEQQMHGTAVGPTLTALGFSAKQFVENKSTDANGVTTSTVKIQPGVSTDGDKVAANEGRSIKATYTQTDKDVFVDLEVEVEEGSPEVHIPLSEYLTGVLVYDSEYACGSIWSNIGYEGIGFEGIENALRLTREFRAFGGRLTNAQENALDSMQRHRDYLAKDRFRYSRYG